MMRFSSLLLALAFVLAAAPARAQAAAAIENVDATYGRIDGDLGVTAGVGVAFGPRDPRGAVDLRFRYLDTAGVFATYEDGRLFGNGSDPVRVLAGGIELRPLFLGRWLSGAELGSARADLAIDSIGLEIGGFLAQPFGGSFGQRPGLQVGLGLELPILSRASGVWLGLHGGVRWSDAVLGGDDVRGPSDRAAFFAVTASWHQIFGAHVVDLRDRAPH